MVEIDIAVEAGQWGDADAPVISKAVEAALSHLGFANTETELSVLLTDNTHMADINGQWRNKPKPTNVLSFPAMEIAPGDAPGPMLGDIVLAHETIAQEASDGSKNFNTHLFHLTVHGLLHLLGYDHELDSDAETMENLEKDILATQGIDDPYMMPE